MLVGFGQDITNRKLIEEKLRQSEAKFRSIFDHASLGVAMVDREGKPVLNNAALQKIVGYSENELRSTPFPDFTYPDDVDKDMALYNDLIENNNRRLQYGEALHP